MVMVMSTEHWRMDEAEKSAEMLGGVVDSAMEQVEGMVVDTEASYEAAGQWLKDAKDRRQELAEERGRWVDPLNEHLRRVRALFKPPLERYDLAISLLQAKRAEYRKRLEAEAKEREEAQRKALEAERAEELKRAEEEARAAREAGNTELAEQVLEEAQRPLVMPVVAAPKVKTEGLTTRKTWKARVVSEPDFVKGVLEGKIGLEYANIKPNTRMLNSYARAVGGRANMPGVVFEEVETEARA